MSEQVSVNSGPPLSIQIVERPPYVVGEWIGAGHDAVRDTADSAVSELLSRSGGHLVLDLSRLCEVADALVDVLAYAANEAQRLGRVVCLVRCDELLYRRLREAGMTGSITHATSVVSATRGLVGGAVSTLDLYLRSEATSLEKLRNVIEAVSQEAGLDAAAEHELKLAVTEAASNAIMHGSPEGLRNHVRVTFHLEANALIVDVEDQGAGFDPKDYPLPADGGAGLVDRDSGEVREQGMGLFLMRRCMDRVEFFRDERGMTVRMTKFV